MITKVTTQAPPPEDPRRGRAKGALTKEERAQILSLKSLGYGTRRIAPRVGRDRKVIRQVLLEAGLIEPPLRATKGPAEKGDEASPPFRTSKLLPFVPAIEERIALELTGSRILREIQELGYSGGRTILLDFLRRHRGKALRKRKAWRRFETRPGLESQVDFSPYRLRVGGREMAVHALSVVLCFSRKIHVRFYTNERFETLIEGLALAFEAFGGVTERVVFDNMAAVVLGRIGKDRKPLFNPRFLEFSRHYGFEPFLCEPNDPDRKGKVERPFIYIEADYLRGLAPDSLDDLNEGAVVWEKTIANRRVHGTTRRIPDEVFAAEEQAFLVRLPAYRFATFREEMRQVGPDCVISVGGTRFSVPARLAQQRVKVRFFGERFEVLDEHEKVVLSRPIDAGSDKGKLVLDPIHYEDVPRRPGPARTEAGRLDDSFLVRFPKAAAFLEGLKTRMKGLAAIHLRTLLRLAESYGDEALKSALARATDYRNFNAQAVRRILEREVPVGASDVIPPGVDPLASSVSFGDAEEVSFDAYAGLDAAPPSRGDEEGGPGDAS